MSFKFASLLLTILVGMPLVAVADVYVGVADVASVGVKSRRVQAGFETSIVIDGTVSVQTRGGTTTMPAGLIPTKGEFVSLNFGAITAFHLRIPFDACLDIAKHAHNKGRPFIVEISGVGDAAEYRRNNTDLAQSPAATHVDFNPGVATAIRCFE